MVAFMRRVDDEDLTKSRQVASILKLWVASLPEPVVPPRLYEAALMTQTAHADKDAKVAALHSLLRQCEHRVLQVLFPLMEVRGYCATYKGMVGVHALTHADTGQLHPNM
jgi:RhoGAP domain